VPAARLEPVHASCYGTGVRTIANVLVASNGRSRRVRALFDTGATVNYLTPQVAKEFSDVKTVTAPFRVGLGGKRHVIKEALPLVVKLDRQDLGLQVFHVVPVKRFDAILGALFMEQWGIRLDPKRRRIEIRRNWHQLQVEY
jgi:predicted aspartyl protease